MVRTRVALTLVLAVGISGCGRSEPTADDFAGELSKSVTVEATTGHLAKLQAIADAHGGRLEIAATSTAGTCVALRLPLAPHTERSA